MPEKYSKTFIIVLLAAGINPCVPEQTSITIDEIFLMNKKLFYFLVLLFFLSFCFLFSINTYRVNNCYQCVCCYLQVQHLTLPKYIKYFKSILGTVNIV